MTENRQTHIEGLRAIAVGAVVVNHAWPQALPGGFAGVDVFFVISGYLIGSQLLAAPPSTGALLRAFWHRRLRRIVPALALVVAVTWLVGANFMTSSEFASLSAQAAAVAVFGSNVLLAHEAGYFAPAAAAQPLLHLWSLSIEMQFYLLAPLVVALGVRTERRTAVWLLRLGVVSLCWLLLWGAVDPVDSFYLLHTRLWELALGTGVAAWQSTRGGPAGPGPRERLVLLGTLAVVAALMALDGWSQQASAVEVIGCVLLLACALAARRLPPSLPAWAPWAGAASLAAALVLAPAANWPGGATLCAVLGTALLIAAPGTSALGRALSWAPLVFVGGISYSLYLWHWPVLSMARLLMGSLSVAPTLACVFVSVALAWATRRLVEDPLRLARDGSGRSRRRLTWLSVAALAGAGALGVVGWAGRGLPWRLPAELQALENWTESTGYDAWRVGRCFHWLNRGDAYASECRPPREPGVPDVLLWGDSHAAHLFPGLDLLARRQRFTLGQWTTGSCPPTLAALLGEGSGCAAKRSWTLLRLRQSPPDVVIVAGAWPLYEMQGSDVAVIAAALQDSVEALRAFGVRRVVVVGSGPVWSTSLHGDLLRSMWSSRRFDRIPERLMPVAGTGLNLEHALTARLPATDVLWLSPAAELCDAGGCLTTVDPTRRPPDLLFFDRDHLTVSGSTLLAERIEPRLAPFIHGR
jgi:peptidoglycan/LPS O-acetylase OafA/YrhL